MTSSAFVVTAVCLGNICRSPMAEAVLAQRLAHLPVVVRSAGTSNWHVGEPADRRAHATLTSRGYKLDHAAAQFTAPDDDAIHLVLVMDSDNYLNVLAENLSDAVEVRMLREFDPSSSHLPVPHPQLDVPDPYYGGADGFDRVLDMIEAAADGVVSYVETQLDQSNIATETSEKF